MVMDKWTSLSSKFMKNQQGERSAAPQADLQDDSINNIEQFTSTCPARKNIVLKDLAVQVVSQFLSV